jgi:hypothetical protein
MELDSTAATSKPAVKCPPEAISSPRAEGRITVLVPARSSYVGTPFPAIENVSVRVPDGDRIVCAWEERKGSNRRRRIGLVIGMRRMSGD